MDIYEVPISKILHVITRNYQHKLINRINEKLGENLDYMYYVKNCNFTTKVKFTKHDYLI